MTDEIHLWDDDILCLEDGEIAFEEDCCCCQDCGCCISLETWATVLFDIHAPDCFCDVHGISGGIASPWQVYDFPCSAGTLSVTCNDVEGSPGLVRLVIRAELVLSDSCCMDSWELEVTVPCYPFDYTFVIPSDDYGCGEGNKCCGDVTVRIYTDDCNSIGYDTCTCRFCHFCMPAELTLTIENVAGCEEIDGAFWQLNCDDDPGCAGEVGDECECEWISGGIVCFGESTTCCFRFKFYGTRYHNRWCDWRLDIWDKDDVLLYEGLRPYAGIPEGLTISFGPISLDNECCTGTFNIHITEWVL
jgi:hypothetical protein